MEGHIRDYELKTGHTRWAAVVYQGKRLSRDGKLRDSYRWIRGFRTRKAASTELTKILTSINNGTYVEPSNQTIAEYLDRWLAMAKPNLAAKTFERYQQLVEVNINPKLGLIQLTKLQPLQLAEFYTWSGECGNRRTGAGLSTQTVLHIHRLLRKALHQAVVWQLRPTNPADAVNAPRPAHKEMQPLNEEQSASLIQSAEGTPMYLPILMGLCTGMRRGELVALRWSDLDLKHARLTVNQSLGETRKDGFFFKNPKNKASRRTITLPAVLVNELRRHRAQQQGIRNLFGPDYPKLDLVLPLQDGTPWPPDRMTSNFVAFTRRIGMQGIRFHDLRHTHASELLSRGIPVKTVSRRLGHANATVTMNIYAHLMSGDDEKAADLVQDVWGNQLGRKGDNEAA